MSKQHKSWFLPSHELVEGTCRLTRLLHRVVAICGLVLVGAGSALEAVKLNPEFFGIFAVILGFVLGFSLLAIAPLSVISLLACTRNGGAIAQNLMVWVFILILWFSEELDWFVTTAFSAYALTVLGFWLQPALSKRIRRAL